MMSLIFIAGCAVAGVAPSTIAAIIKIESGYNPLAINVNGQIKSPSTADNPQNAAALATTLIAKGFNIDMGLMQINSSHLKPRHLSATELFDPCRNIAIGSQILKENYELAERSFGPGQQALKAALSAYNTGSMHGERGLQYVGRFYPAADSNQADIQVAFDRK